MTEGNPYQVASSPSRAIGGRVDAVAALRDGLRGALANAGTLVVCGVVGVLVYYAGVCSLLGWLLAVPALFWGFSKLFLQAARGQARFESLWIGSDHVGVRLQRAWGLLFLYLFASLPVYALLAVLSVFWLGDLLENPALLLGEGFQLKLMGLTVASSAAAAVWGLVLCRIVPAAFYLVDQDLGAVESMTHAWSRSARSWPALMALHVVMLMLTQPLSLVSLVAQFQPSVLGIAPTAAMGLPWLSMLFGMAASAFYYVAMASAYDQIEGRGAYARVD